MSEKDKEDDHSTFKEKNGAIVTDLLFLEKVSAMDQAKNFKQKTFEMLHLQPGQKILDLGCGNGDGVISISQLIGISGLSVGLDVNREAIESDLKKIASDNKNIQFLCQSGENIPFENDYFDAIRSERVFQHLKDYKKLLKEMIRVTKPNGKILIADPDWDSIMINSDDKKITRTVIKEISD